MDRGEERDYQGIIDYFGLTKEDFLRPIDRKDKPDLFAGALFQIYCVEPQLRDRIEFLVRSLGIQREDIVEAGKDFVAIEEPRMTWDVYFLDKFPDLFQEAPGENGENDNNG